MADGTRLTVGSLVGLPMGVVREQSAAPAPPASPAIEEQEGPGWRVTAGMVTRNGGAAWRADGIEALTFNNPFGQVMERVWFDRKVVFAVDLGRVVVNPTEVKVAQEYQIVYGVELDADGRSVGEGDAVP